MLIEFLDFIYYLHDRGHKGYFPDGEDNFPWFQRMSMEQWENPDDGGISCKDFLTQSVNLMNTIRLTGKQFGL